MPSRPLRGGEQTHPRTKLENSLDQPEVGGVVLDAQHRSGRDRRFLGIRNRCPDCHLSVRPSLSIRGNSIQNVLPLPSILSTPIFPCIASTSPLDSVSPSPVPSTPFCSASRRSNGANSRCIFSGAMPGPVSVTLIRTSYPLPPRRNGDRAPLPVVLDGVGQQVQQDLLEPLEVGAHGTVTDPGLRRQESHAGLVGQGLDHPQHFSHHLAQIHFLRGNHSRPPGLDAGDVEDLVNQGQQVPASLDDLLDAFALRVTQGVHFQQLAEAQDDVQRGAQFVTHAREELALGPVGGFGGLLGQGQLGRAYFDAPFQFRRGSSAIPARTACAR